MYLVLGDGMPPADPNNLPKPTPEAETEFYYRMGAALASWQDIEILLSLILTHLVKPAEKETFMVSLHEVYSFKTRNDMLTAAIAARFPEASDTWSTLKDKIDRKARRRNLLAHLVAYFDPTEKRPSQQLFLGRTMLTKPATIPAKEWVREGHVDANQMKEMIAAFTGLRDQIVKFAQSLPEPAML